MQVFGVKREREMMKENVGFLGSVKEE